MIKHTCSMNTAWFENKHIAYYHENYTDGYRVCKLLGCIDADTASDCALPNSDAWHEFLARFDRVFDLRDQLLYEAKSTLKPEPNINNKETNNGKTRQ